MNELYQSPILNALGWAIAGSFWQMGLLWLIHQIVFVIPFRQKPGIKHGSAVLLLGIGTIWFMSTLFLRLNRIREMQSYIFQIDNDHAATGTTVWSLNGLVTKGEKFLPYFSAAYLIVLIFLFFRLAQGFIVTQKIFNSKQAKPAGHWQHFVDRMCLQLNINRNVIIYLSEVINVPATIGFIKPVILLPLATLNNLSIREVEAIILHEIAHIKRFDYLINIIVSIVETLLFFNPFARLFSLSIRKERELCCDDFVIHYQRDPHCYANALLSLEKSRIAPTMAMAATGKETLLLGRVKRILQVPDQQIQYRHRLIALFIVASLIMFLAILNPPKPHLQKATNSAYLFKKQDGSNFNYSLPTIFKSIESESPDGKQTRETVVRSNEQKKIKADKKIKDKGNQFQDLAFGNGIHQLREELQYEAPLAIANGPVFFSPEWPQNYPAPLYRFDNNMSFEYSTESHKDEAEADLHRTHDDAQNMNRRKTVRSSDKTDENEESLVKLFGLVDMGKFIESNDQLKMSIGAQSPEATMPRVRSSPSPEAMMPGLRAYQNQVYRKKVEMTEQELKKMETDAIQYTRARTKSKAVIHRFSSEDGTQISIIQENGKIEITLKDNR